MSTSTIKLTESEVQNCTWAYNGEDEHYRYWIGKGTHPVTGTPITVMKKEFLQETDLVTLNAEERNARDGKPWSSGSGSEKGGNVPLIRVARIPLAKLYDEIVPRMKQGDKDHLRWFLNREENQPFRTRSGRL